MGVLAVVKKNRIGAVVISVFDWYRTFILSNPMDVFDLTLHCSIALPSGRKEAASEA
jgi:hypothetical protein